nr:TonB-dependent receptor [Polymorphobacter sp.]
MLHKSQSAPSARLRGVLLLGAALAATPALAQTVTAAADEAVAGEIIVTAERRSESLQKVPVAITAIGTAKLDQLQVQSFNDFARFLPSLSFQSAGPGTANIYFRGVASGGDGNHSGPLPSVGVYLDEQPITTIGGTLDLHIYDIARVEALAGPQGTLYGASSQAGTIRYISNKPEFGKFSAGYNLEVNKVVPDGNSGGWGGVAEAFVNVPISDNAALRVVGWYDRDGGYIDNVAGTRTYSVPGITINNDKFVKDNYNTVETIGGRAQLRLAVNDDWTFTPSIMGQTQRSKGFFGQDPNLDDLQVTHYAPESAKDDWFQASLTIEGHLSDFDIVYTGSYLKRKVESHTDYSDYSFFYDAFYTSYVDFIKNNAGQFIDPSQRIDGTDRFTKFSQEFRISSPTDKRLRFIAGAFYQRQTRDIEQNYNIAGLADELSITTKPGTWWLTKQDRVDRDYAVFGQAAFDIVENVTLTGGGRFFIYDNSLIGFFGFGAGNPLSTPGESLCFAPATTDGAPCTNLGFPSRNGVAPKRAQGQGFTHKLNLAWQATPDQLVYATWSRGFRPGGLNRRGTLPPFDADFLTNYEIGWKGSFFDRHLRINAAVFQEEWKSIQLAFLGGNGLTEIQNAGNARIRGAEFDATVALLEGLTITASGTYTDAKLTTNYCRIANSDDCAQLGPNGEDNFIRAPIGQQLPVTAKFNGNLIGRYEFPMFGGDAFVQGAANHVGSRWAALRTDHRDTYGKMPSYTVADFSIGIRRDSWTAELYANNAFDSRGNLNRFAQCSPGTCGGITYQIVTQPRTIGVKFGQRF